MLFAWSVCAVIGLLGSAVSGQIVGLTDCDEIANWTPTSALETKNEPVFSAGESVVDTLDTLDLVWYNPNKFTLTGVTANEVPVPSSPAWTCQPGTQGDPVRLPDGTLHNAGCYNRCVYKVNLQELMAGEATATSTQNDFLRILGKMNVGNNETFTVFAGQGTRNETITRDIESAFIFEIGLPLVTSGTTTNLTGLFPPNRLAAIILQSVDVQIDGLIPTGRVLILTQFQWPFKLEVDGSTGLVVQAQNGIPTTATLLQDCADPGLDAAPGRDGTNVELCNQVWEVILKPGVQRPQQCQLDGSYKITGFLSTCQPAYSDCPIATPVDESISFILDSENFCPNVLEDIQLTATLEAFNDAALTDSSGNFLQDDMIYFKSVVISNQVSIESATLKSMTVTFDSTSTNPSRRLQYDVDSLPPVAAEVVDFNPTDGLTSATELSFEFRLTDPPFTLPVDGSQQFSVDIEIDVTYVGISASNPLLLEERRMLLQAGSGTEASTRARASGAVSPKDGGASSASATGAAAALALATAALFA
jgi:hypothetical protein